MQKKILKLNVIDRDGNKQSIESEEGITIREAIMDKLAPGMFALCEGNCICATCHVHVAENDFSKLKSVQEDEIETMTTNDISKTPFSRLSCQIELEPELDGITVTIAPVPSL